MPNYTLNIAFDQAGLQALSQAGQSVTIAKQSAGGLQTAWITFQPQLNNIVTWTEQYSVYASTTNAQAGAQIITSSQATAIGGSSYNLNTAGYFDPGVPNVVASTQYEINNGDPNLKINNVAMVTGGLVQGATVNGAALSAPICAVGILFNQQAIFTPIETIQIYTSSYSNNGIVISQVAGNALTVTYTTNSTASVAYNDQNNQFIMS
ncbi:hypothetical protein MUU53_05590 [Rhizobium lemnae]|uniref:Uncharacterized protein n=1 Tax=Rhizobium lemnae TaxID=1214924 RepID=A0ABV8EDT5_9HYPH|nr:hypothetical protein [Rhizobium lemnae]MCJ8507385.1 hypothetical protein [Rhizobium lemnae]